MNSLNDMVRNFLLNNLYINKVNDDIDDIHLDSLDFISLLAQVEDEYNVVLFDNVVYSYDTTMGQVYNQLLKIVGKDDDKIRKYK